MKRNMDLVRRILLELEKAPCKHEGVELKMEGYSPEEVSYHVMLMAQAGLIKAVCLPGTHMSGFTSTSDFLWLPKSLTWQGHEFLDASRNESIWNKAKTIMAERVGEIPFEVLKQLLIDLAKGRISGSS